jgi:uncharacterized phiE125 gp8 family phage protein
VALNENALIDIAYLDSMQSHDMAAEDDAFAEELINQASAMAERYCGRVLASRSVSSVVDAPGGSALVLPEYPVSAVTAVYLDTAREFGATTEITDYYLEESTGILFRDAGYGSGVRVVKVVYTAGYSPVPSDLQEAVVELVHWLWSRHRTQSIGIRVSRGLDGVETEHELTMPLATQRVLGQYRRIA